MVWTLVRDSTHGWRRKMDVLARMAPAAIDIPRCWYLHGCCRLISQVHLPALPRTKSTSHETYNQEEIEILKDKLPNKVPVRLGDEEVEVLMFDNRNQGYAHLYCSLPGEALLFD